MHTETLRAFHSAGLGIKGIKGPIVPIQGSIFQLDIHRSRASEYFRIWPGAPDNVFRVLDVDPRFRQVVLSVIEPRRRFEQILLRRGPESRESVEVGLRAEGGRVLRETRRQFVLERWTSAVERRYLCGFDEQRLFIAQIRRGGTVDEAHDALLPDEARSSPGPIARQGEWFFLPVAKAQLEALEGYAATHRRSHRRVEAIVPGGQPHVAEELLRVDRRERQGRRELRFLDLFVRGRVHHVDHRAVVFQEWRRTVRNLAVLPAGAEDARLRWID